MQPFIGLAFLAGIVTANVQQPLAFEAETDEYQFTWPIQRVAVIGAGPSGLVAYRELTEAGLNVRIFERDSVPGGNWHYTDEVPLDAPVPNAPCAIGDYVPSLPPDNVDLPYSDEFDDDGNIQRNHRGPRPIWESLTTNVPSPLQQFLRFPWPTGTHWELSHYHVRNYIRSYASYLGINSNDESPAAAYNTRVERIEKRINDAGQEHGWRLWLKSLEQTPRDTDTYRATWWTEDFDAVVVAAGRYNAPIMPSIPGLEQWVQRFPGLLRHSRQYRRPEGYANQTVLIIGAADSGCEISRDLNHQARKVYQSFRAPSDNRSRHKMDLAMRRIPRNTTFVGEIKEFLPIPEGSSIQSGLVELVNGTILSGIDSVILSTGFRYSYPFLPHYYDDAPYAPHEGSAPTVSPFLPTDGSHIRDLYLDMFYIHDPTLAFIGATSGTLTFYLADYTALSLAKVWTGAARLPDGRTMRTVYDANLEERGGYGKNALYLGSQRFRASVAYLIGWLNEAAVKYGGKQVDGLPTYIDEVGRYWKLTHFGAPFQARDEVGFIPLGGMPGSGGDAAMDEMSFFDGDW